MLEGKRLLAELLTLLFLYRSHRDVLGQVMKPHGDGLMLEFEVGSGHMKVTLCTAKRRGGIYLDPIISEQLHASKRGHDPGLSARELVIMQHVVSGLIDQALPKSSAWPRPL